MLKTGHMAWFKIYNAEVEGRGETLVIFIIMEDYKITGIDFIFLQKTLILISRYLIRVLLIQQIQSLTYEYSPPMYAWLMAINREPPHAIFLTNLHRGNRSLTSLSLYIYIQQKLKIIFAETMSGVWVFKNGVVRLVDRDLASRQPTKKKVLIHLPTDEVVSSHSSLEQILICCSNHDFVCFLSNLHHHFYSPSLLHVFASIFIIFVRLDCLALRLFAFCAFCNLCWSM